MDRQFFFYANFVVLAIYFQSLNKVKVWRNWPTLLANMIVPVVIATCLDCLWLMTQKQAIAFGKQRWSVSPRLNNQGTEQVEDMIVPALIATCLGCLRLMTQEQAIVFGKRRWSVSPRLYNQGAEQVEDTTHVFVPSLIQPRYGVLISIIIP